jgi:hypothetical protein
MNYPKSNYIIDYLYNNQRFDLSPDLNKIIFKKKITNMKNLIDMINNNFKEQIINSFAYIKNEKLLNDILNMYFGKNDINITISHIHHMLNTNNYFAKIFTNYFINNYDEYIKTIHLDTKAYINTLHHMVLNLDDIEIIENLLKKLNSIDNNRFIVKIKQSKNILFKRLYQKINLIELLNQI